MTAAATLTDIEGFELLVAELSLDEVVATEYDIPVKTHWVITNSDDFRSNCDEVLAQLNKYLGLKGSDRLGWWAVNAGVKFATIPVPEFPVNW